MNSEVGVDIVEIARIEAMVERYGERFKTRIFTPGELAECRGRMASLAARWAAKEAVSKALGTGIGRIRFTEIEVVQGEVRKPSLRLTGQAQAQAEALGLTRWSVSLSHDGGMAIAFVLGMGEG